MNWKLIRFIDSYLGIPILVFLGFLRRIFENPRRTTVTGEYRNVLLVKFWGIGNLFMLLPAAAEIRQRFPSCRIDLLTLESNRDAARTAGDFNAVHAIDTASTLRFAVTCAANARLLRRQRYDLVVDFEQFARFSAIFCRLISGKESIGFRTKGQHRHALFTHSQPYDNGIHIRHSFLSLVPPEPARPRRSLTPPFDVLLPPRSKDTAYLSTLSIPPHHSLIVMHIGTSANFQERRWPAEYAVELADRLIDQFDVHVAFTAHADECPSFPRARHFLRNKERTTDLTGRLDFPSFFRLIRSSDLVISADTSAVHIASFIGIPVVGLYGPNTPLLYGPWGPRSLAISRNLPCSPCITNFNAKIHTCGHADGRGACMVKISVTEVFDAITNTYFDRNAPYRNERTVSGVPCAAS